MKKPVYTPGLKDPLFIRFLNGHITGLGVMDAFLRGTKDDKTKEIVTAFIAAGVEPDLKDFKTDFKNLVKDFSENGPIHPVREYLNSYMEPSLLEVPENSSVGNMGETTKWLMIRNPEAPWLEAVVCYNLSIYVHTFGHHTIKECPLCNKFFTQGKYKYKYCSESCKVRSGG